MRTTLAAAILLAAIALGQPPATPKADPKTDPKPPPKVEDKADSKATAKEPAKDAAQSVEWPTEVGGKSLQQWIKEINSNDPSMRKSAIVAVRAFGPTSRQAIPAILNELRKQINDITVKAHAIISIGIIVPSSIDIANEQAIAKEAVDALIREGLNSQQSILRLHACTALPVFGSLARNAVPILARLSADQYSFELRQAACAALGVVAIDDQGWGDMLALKALVEAIRDPAREVRIDAMQAIIGLPPPAPGNNINQMKSLLERYLRVDHDKEVVIWTRVALMRIDPGALSETNLTVIAKLMKGQNLETRVAATKALGVLAKDAKSKIPELTAVLQSEDSAVIITACWALGRMGTFAIKALPSLDTLLKHKDEYVRTAAEAAIKEIKPKPPDPPPAAPGKAAGKQ